jgi:hypothetical protein
VMSRRWLAALGSRLGIGVRDSFGAGVGSPIGDGLWNLARLDVRVTRRVSWCGRHEYGLTHTARPPSSLEQHFKTVV